MNRPAFVARPTASLVDLFATPPAAFSPVPIWWWSGDPLDPVRLRQQMEQLVAGGIRQAVVLNLAPSGPLFGSLADEPAFFVDAWWSLFEGVCRDADELGFHLWFYDQLGFSGADVQGQLVQREPACRGRALDRVVLEVHGTGTVQSPADSESLAAFALPHSGDGPIRLAVRDGAATWTGHGRLVLAYSVDRGFDYLDKRSCELLLDSVHGEFERRLGKHLGSTIVGSFQDELPSMPTWSATFAEQFRARRGYDLLEQITALWGDGDPAVRADYQRTRGELAEEAFFQPLGEWHAARGLAVGCDQQHPARAGYPLEATQQYADYLRTHRWFSAPGSDHWGDAKVHSSLAHLYGHPRTWVEAFHSTGWGGTLEETFDWLLPWLRAGATLYNPHAVYYSTRGGRWEWAPPSTCWRQPYWRHYPLFARTVARLCAALSWGDHVCDIGVLYPSTAVQAELRLDLGEELLGQPPGVSSAQDTYLDVVGRMHWFDPQPGVLDRDCRDFDVLDDDSVVRGTLEGAVLRIGKEAYGVVVLPGCSQLEPATAEALRAFAVAGGSLIAVGAVPGELADVVVMAPSPEDLAQALARIPRRVSAPVPTLLRADGESAVLLVVGASPGATVQPPERAWRTEGYSFDPGRYARTMQVSVRDVAEPVAVWEPGTGTARPLAVNRVGHELQMEVPVDHGPCSLVVFGPAASAALTAADGDVVMAQPGPERAPQAIALQSWTGELIPTLDNTWGDFASPASPGPVPFQIWHLEHEQPDGSWRRLRATYGPRGEMRRRDQQWQPVIWSDRFGAAHDDAEPRGYVPEEFLDLGDVEDGEQVDLRFVLRSDAARRAYLTVGSTAAKTIRWNGSPAEVEGSVYLDSAVVDVEKGDNLLELALTASTARRLRTTWSLRPEPEVLPRPEWVVADRLTRVVDLATVPDDAMLQLGTLGRVTLSVNGSVAARHGEFDNYGHVRQPRVRRYDVREHLVAGRNELVLEMHDPGTAAVVDAFFDDVCVVTDGTWSGRPGGVAEVPYDPRWIQLRTRPHPLPRAEGEPVGQHVGALQSPGQEQPTQRFRFSLPPGATELRLPVPGRAVVVDDGVRTEAVGGVHRLQAPADAGRVIVVEVQPNGRSGGALWDGPVEVALSGSASIPLGDWTQLGLQDWSGGVRYRAVVRGRVDVRALDLGLVRGTAELRVNGRAAGCRIWSPYRFDVSGLFDVDENVVEVDVYNTLAPYVAAVSPSPWVLPGQTVSGLLGPVTLHVEPHASPEDPTQRTTQEQR